jgi:hypothetical protein
MDPQYIPVRRQIQTRPYLQGDQEYTAAVIVLELTYRLLRQGRLYFRRNMHKISVPLIYPQWQAFPGTVKNQRL